MFRPCMWANLMLLLNFLSSCTLCGLFCKGKGGTRSRYYISEYDKLPCVHIRCYGICYNLYV